MSKITETGPPVKKPRQAKPAENRRLMTKKDLEEYLSVSDRTVDDIVSKRKIDYIKFGREVRFRLADVERVLAKCTVKRVSL